MNTQRIEQYRLTLLSNDQMYESVVERNSKHDGDFFYGVVTTGVFCKPSCSSRTPRRENTRFFADIESAVQAGFRACQRCHPDNMDRELNKQIEIARYIQTHADERLTLAELSHMANLSPSHFQKLFKSTFGVSPKQFQDAARLARLKGELKSGEDVTGAIFSAGFGSVSRVYGEALRSMGMTPATYREGGANETIFHAYRDSCLGPLLMAATKRGVCFAQFGDSRALLVDQLRHEFPNAMLIESTATEGPDLDNWIDALDTHLQNHAPRPDLPLDLRGTSFQLKVWRFLLNVKEGDVLSYGELASGIGSPKAFRAAASACGVNRVCVLVPCHRVLRGNGELGGYRWGVERKRTLLEIERQRTALAK